MAREKLRVISGEGEGNEVPLNGDFIVGRGETGPGNLSGDAEISRRHARFTRSDEGHVVVEDLGSTNGTYVNGRRVSAPTVLANGDEIKLGQTVVRFDGGPDQTRVATPVQDKTQVRQAVPTPTPTPAPARPPAAAQGAAVGSAGAATGVGNGGTAPPASPDGGPALPPAGGPVSDRPAAKGGGGASGLKRHWIDLIALLVATAVVVAVSVTNFGDRNDKVAAPNNCGSNLGGGNVSLVSYSLSNLTPDGKNFVLITPYGPNMKPGEISKCDAGGTGSSQLKMPGTVDGNDQLIVNPQHTLLFGVNQGSDSIAVFQIQKDGSLKASPGSPYPSGGKAPASLGLSGDTLVVANKARDGVRDLEGTAPNFTSFKVAADGKLTQVQGSSVPAKPMTAPTSAVVPDSGGVVFGLSDGGPIHTMTVDGSGKLAEGTGSPSTVPAQAFAAGTPPPKQFALGVRAHPTKPFVYMALPTVPALAVFQYDKTGKLTFVTSVPTVGAFLPCWIQITKDGRWLYTSSAGTNNITVFDIQNPAKPKQIQDLPFDEPGNAWNIQLDPTDKFLFAITPRAVPAVPMGKGNLVHVMSIGPDGKLTEVNKGAPVKLPVPQDATPYGLAVVKPGS